MKIKLRIAETKSKLNPASKIIKKRKSQTQCRIGAKCFIIPRCYNKCHKIERAPGSVPCSLEEEKPNFRDMMTAIYSYIMVFDTRCRYFQNYAPRGKFLVAVLMAVNLVLLTDLFLKKLFPTREPTLFENYKNWLFYGLQN